MSMSFRINPYKIIRLVGLIVVLSYGFVEISEFRKKKMQETGKVEKTLNVRKQISQVYLNKFLKQTKNLRKQMKHSRK